MDEEKVKEILYTLPMPLGMAKVVEMSDAEVYLHCLAKVIAEGDVLK